MNKLTWLLASTSLGVVMVAGCGDNSSSLECGANTTEQNGVCVADPGSDTTCGTGTVAMGTECVPDGSVICETGTTFEMATGTCVADITGCGTGTVVVDGECKDPADVTADVSEAMEPNDLGPDGTPGMIDLPTAGNAITISGCIEPTTVNGQAVIDDDSYIFQTMGPTLLDITIDGFGGTAGAFTIGAGDPALNDAGFVRFGINLAGDMSQRQVFLPVETVYGITFTDSRALFFGEAAGGPGACYLATIRNVAMPMPTAITVDTALDGTFGAETQFLRFTPAADGNIAASTTTAPNESAMIDTVLMVNGQYQGSSPGLGGRDFGEQASNLRGDLNTADMVMYVVDPVINLALNPVDFSHIVGETGSTAIDTAGGTVSSPTTGDPNDPTVDSYLSFTVANDGDVVFLDLDVSDFSTDVDWRILDASLNQVAIIENFSGGVVSGHYQFALAGLYYIEIRDFSGSVVDPFDVVSTQIDHTPTPIVVGTPMMAQAFGVDNAAFYSITPDIFEWWNTTGTPTGFDGPMLLDSYNLGQPGQLGVDVPEINTLPLVDGENNIALLEGVPPLLFKVSDDGANAAGTFDFSIAENPFTDLGFVDAATPANLAVTAAGPDTYYIAQGINGEVFNIVVTGNNGFDPVLVLVDANGETIVDANVGADTVEGNLTAVINGKTPFAVRDVAGVGGDFTIDVTIVQTLNVTSTPALAIPDNDPAGVSDIITVGACTIGLVDIDVDVTHTWRGDISMTVTSPLATAALIQDQTGGSADDVIGNYPNTLTPVDDLSVFNGEEAMGDWTLDITDGANGDTGILNSWGINFVCF